MIECPNCEKMFSGRTCPSCGFAPAASAPRRCHYDGEELREDAVGWGCSTGYPYAMPNPKYHPSGTRPETLARLLRQHRRTACPHCREPLEWDGGCLACHGAGGGGRAAWIFPGARYDLSDADGRPIGDGQHWVKTDGPRPACSPEQNRVRVLALQRRLAASPLGQPSRP